MNSKESLREATRHLAEIEKQLNELVEDLKQRQERLREDSSLLKTMSVPSESRARPHKSGMGGPPAPFAKQGE